MSTSDSVFAGSVPEIYDSHMVPLIFQPYADDLARRVAALRPRDLLETAAGTGVVTRAMARALGPDARLTITDLNQPMLDRNRSRLADDPRLTWRQADALALPFADRSFDVVVCQFGAMFFPDRVKGFAEALRVLRPGGRFLFNVWDRIEANVFSDIVVRSVAELFPADPPRFLARTPHGYHDTNLVRSDVERAGFTAVSLQTLPAVSRAPSARDAAFALYCGTPMRAEIEERGAGRLDEAVERAAAVIAARFGNGPVEAPIQAHVIEAVRPA